MQNSVDTDQFVCLRLYVLVNNFSVIFGRLPGFNQYSAMGMKCLAQGHNTAPRVRMNPQPCDQESDALPTELSVLPDTDQTVSQNLKILKGNIKTITDLSTYSFNIIHTGRRQKQNKIFVSAFLRNVKIKCSLYKY